jgi:hypothetical protein
MKPLFIILSITFLGSYLWQESQVEKRESDRMTEIHESMLKLEKVQALNSLVELSARAHEEAQRDSQQRKAFDPGESTADRFRRLNQPDAILVQPVQSYAPSGNILYR